MSSKKAHSLMVTLAEGLTGYMTYQTRTGISPAFNKYLLCDPVVRIARDKLWKVFSNEIVDLPRDTRVDNSIDFFLRSQTHNDLVIGLQLQWITDETSAMDLSTDIEKLNRLRFSMNGLNLYNFILLAEHHTRNTVAPEEPAPHIDYADSDHLILCYRTTYPTRYSNYSATVFEVKVTNQLHL